MLYDSYQLHDDMMAPLRNLAEMTIPLLEAFSLPMASQKSAHLSAYLQLLARFKLSHSRPDFGIERVRSGNADVEVSERVALGLPFADLLHFQKDIQTEQPKVLVVAPLSGHFSTLLSGTVTTLLQDHDVYITDWRNARDVPLDAGRFGVDDYVDYIVRFLEEIGPGTHVLAVCQPCVQALVAAAVMAAEDNPAAPRSMTLMAGPVDPLESPTSVNELAVKKSLAWFESSVISTVPPRYAGAGRRVYPGFVQLSAFLAMNMPRHQAAHRRLYEYIATGNTEEARKIKEFYDEYFAVIDLTEEFYIETIDLVFQRAALAKGEFTHRGQTVDPSAIRRTALLTVEGGRDDICGMGQTAAAHDLCSSLRPHLKRHHLQANVGHFGVFSGRRWETYVYPVVRNFILALE